MRLLKFDLDKKASISRRRQCMVNFLPGKLRRITSDVTVGWRENEATPTVGVRERLQTARRGIPVAQVARKLLSRLRPAGSGPAHLLPGALLLGGCRPSGQLVNKKMQLVVFHHIRIAFCPSSQSSLQHERYASVK